MNLNVTDIDGLSEEKIEFQEPNGLDCGENYAPNCVVSRNCLANVTLDSELESRGNRVLYEIHHFCHDAA